MMVYRLRLVEEIIALIAHARIPDLCMASQASRVNWWGLSVMRPVLP